MRHPFRASVLAIAAGGATLTSGTPRVQALDAPWRTIRTAHYRIHYPARAGHGFEAFAKDVASRIEGIHGLFQDWVGHTLAGPTDVVIQNPVATSNGMTLVSLNRPHVILWTEIPESDSDIAHFHDFTEDLVVHELVHLHHLTWPDRGSRGSKLTSPLRHSDVALKSPGWVSEGYATLLEGRLTGSGRPHGLVRATLLREWARAGRLPDYSHLSQGDPVLGGGSRYHLGSAFLEWLERSRTKDPKALQLLWRRLSSRRFPTFDRAFEATFGEAPEIAYGRFCAELTHTALEMERRVTKAGLREGEAWAQTPGFLRELSVSPDGTHLLAQAFRQKEAGIWVWDLKAPRDSESQQKKARKVDGEFPEDAPELRPERTPAHRLGSVAFSLPDRPAWTEQGAIRFERRVADGEGVYHRQVDTWAPLPAQRQASTLRTYRPEWSPKGWSIQVEGRSLLLPFEPFGLLTWDSARRLLYATTEVEGLLTIVRLPMDPTSERPFGALQPLTRSLSGAAYPAPTPDGKTLYFQVLTPVGSQIRTLDLAHLEPLPGWEAEAHPLAPETVRAAPDEPTRVPAPLAPPPSHPYSVAESHHLAFRTGAVLGPSESTYLLGVGGNDILGRLNWQVLGAVGGARSEGLGPRGAMAGAAWRGWAWQPSLHAYSVLERPSRSQWVAARGWDQERRGLEGALTRAWWNQPFEGEFRIALLQERVGGEDRAFQRSLGEVGLRQAAGYNRGRFSARLEGEALGSWGRTEGASWSLQRGAFQGTAAWKGFDLGFSVAHGQVQGQPSSWDRFHLGGQFTGLLPDGATRTQVFQPALPTYLATGTRFSRWRAQTGLLYVEGTALWDEGQGRPAFTRVAGLEAKGNFGDLPMVGEVIRRYLGRLDLSVGLHRVLDGPVKDHTRATVAFTYRF